MNNEKMKERAARVEGLAKRIRADVDGGRDLSEETLTELCCTAEAMLDDVVTATHEED